MAEISEIAEKISGVVANIEEIAKQPSDKKTIESLETQVKNSFDWLKEGKTKLLFAIASRQYKKGDIDANRYKDILTQNVKNEMEKGLILLVLKNSEPLSPHQISMKGNVPLTRMYQHIVSLLKDGEIKVTGETKDSLIFSRSKKGE